MSFLNLYVLEKFVYFFKCDNVKVVKKEKRKHEKECISYNNVDLIDRIGKL